MISFDDAVARLEQALGSVRLPVERRPVRSSVGCTLRDNVCSRLDLPPFNKSAMDGYAIRAGDNQPSYRLVETIAAGAVGQAELTPGTTVKIMTGAPVPPGTGRVIKIEDALEQNGVVTFSNPGRATNICLQGEDMRAGQQLFAAGRRLDEVDVTNVISCGVMDVTVSRPTRVAVISTGDEIVDSADALTPGKIMNANGPLLAALARSQGLEVVLETTVKDDRAATATTLRNALNAADVVILSGGVSAGDFDYVPDVMRQLGLEILFSRVAVKPGKPTTCAVGGGKVVFGLPGNPVTVCLTFHLFVQRAVARISGGTAVMPCEFIMPLGVEFRRRTADRREYVPCRVRPDGKLEMVSFHGSAHLAALSESDGFFVVERAVATIAVGEAVPFLPVKLRGLR